MRFFDFLFLIIFKFYKSFNEKGAQSSAAGAVGFFIAANILTVLVIVSLTHKKQILLSNKLYIILGAIFFQIVFHIRYISRDKINLPIILKRWYELNETQKKIYRYCALTYIISSLLLLFFVAIYSGNQY